MNAVHAISCRRIIKKPDSVHDNPEGRHALPDPSQTKPIGYLKANAAEVLTHLAEQRKPLIITHNGVAKAVLQDVASYEETRDTLALLKFLAMGYQGVAAGRVKPAGEVIARLRAKRTPG
ncbi:MAG: type II toxin-antitoxin system Phd/YefM family antitoxin [Burkholderiales bacterium]|nr:type II toxin-antitoxin system Phd/YefM family antitoxin [Burkholderiales bacterium]